MAVVPRLVSMKKERGLKKADQQIVFASAFDMLMDNSKNHERTPLFNRPMFGQDQRNIESETGDHPAITSLSFPFLLKPDQIKAVEAWVANRHKGSIIYGTGTGKTEIAFECARIMAQSKRAKQFKILILVPRKILVQQNYERLTRYNISSEKIGKYFGEEKQIKEITIATYHSALVNLEIIRRADMVVFDEVHLARGAFSKIFDVVRNEDKALLGLTATIDENDSRNAAIMSLLPPIRKYLIRDAVLDKRLARPIIFPIKVSLTDKEQTLYDEYSAKIRNISHRFKRYDAKGMMELMKQDGFPRWQAKAWFLNVKKRKKLLASSEHKLSAAANLIAEKYCDEKVMVFSETLESVRNLKQLLKDKGIDSALIESSTLGYRRQKILSEWGKKFQALLSVHTLEIGYDVPEARAEIILATTSNMNQIVQRIGRVLRKVKGKDFASIYLIYVEDTKDHNILSIVREAIESSGGSEKDTNAAGLINY